MIRTKMHALFHRQGRQASPILSYHTHTFHQHLLGIYSRLEYFELNQDLILHPSNNCPYQRNQKGLTLLSAFPEAILSYQLTCHTLTPATSSVLKPTTSQLNTFGESPLQGSYSILFGFPLLLPRLREGFTLFSQNPGGSSCLHPHLDSSGITTPRQTLSS